MNRTKFGVNDDIWKLQIHLENERISYSEEPKTLFLSHAKKFDSWLIKTLKVN